MCVCVYLYSYYKCICVRACVDVCMHVRMHICRYACNIACMSVLCVYVILHVCAYACMYVRAHMCIRGVVGVWIMRARLDHPARLELCAL